ncbi:1-propanol dehydrogenase PduQ [Companilactobacillus nodensis]|uniref:Bifunctional alcohol dehydrogenase acetaldehyde dehydrogenase n=1 Tax=Companilactobacillus nodensis DSM 19682 = JCM 14932 = NBRC 107160 TaxID=1423775 RepID=A0A0R1KGX0_9LACO|nr:1-propanol dehydrogenase PduQ [Companilactobacillus nodensis]KRK79761.1 bifunctional alcohol dehydrogenase acetaldehyde dehydrogenase [Companilactobacillus nodensis DSM 19682 = JCM 14932 = NBRC 107160]
MGSFKMPTKIYSGHGAVDKIRDFGINRALVICDPFMEKSHKVDNITKVFDELKTPYAVFSEVVPDPSIDVVSKGIAKAIEIEPDAIIALGGGSALDTAKSVRHIYYGVKNDKKIQLICVPTTSGTGSEVTSFAVISDPAKNGKYALVDESMVPDIAILDSEFTLSVPAGVTADTGMDVLTHTLEAYVSTDATDFTDALAEKAMRIIWEDLVDVYKDGSNAELREKVHNASCLAGMAFSEASLGISHSLAHALGGRFHIAHGRCNAMLLPYVVAYNAGLDLPTDSEPALAKYQQAAKMLGVQSGTAKTSVTLLISRIQRMSKQMNIPKTIEECGIDNAEFMEAIPDMAAAAMNDKCTLTNPRQPKKEDLEGLYKRICRGGF